MLAIPIAGTTRTEDQVEWEIVDEHLDEADWLLGTFVRTLDSPVQCLAQLAEHPEEPLLNHLDALIEAGAPALDQRVIPALEEASIDAPMRVASAAMVAIATRTCDALWPALDCEHREIRDALVLAARLAGEEYFDDWLHVQLATQQTVRRRASLLDLAAARRLVSPNLMESLQNDDSALVAAAVRAARHGDRGLYAPVIEHLLVHPAGDVRDAALVASLAWGSARAWGACERAALDPANTSSVACQLYASLGGSERNPVGCGLVLSGNTVDGQPLPNFELPSARITDSRHYPLPAGFGPVARHWRPRRGLAGTYDETWVRKRAPYWPSDFDPRFFLSAPPALCAVPHLVGGERVSVVGAHPDGNIEFLLPTLRLSAKFNLRQQTIRKQMTFDGLRLEPDEKHFTMTFRAALKMGKGMADLERRRARFGQLGRWCVGHLLSSLKNSMDRKGLRMDWSDIERGDPLEMPALLAFLERNAPGSTRRMRGASEERIAAVAEPLQGGTEALPRVYREYLRTMGERRFPMNLMWGLPEVSALLAARKRPQTSTAPKQYFKYAYGMTVNLERADDQFLDLGRRIGGGVDAHVVVSTDRELAMGRPAEEVFESFSDQLRFSAVTVVEKYLGFSDLEGLQPERVRDMFDALRNMGFEVTELGACVRHIPLVAPGKAMVAMMTTSGTWSGDPHVNVAARDEKQLSRTIEIIKGLRDRWRAAR